MFVCLGCYYLPPLSCACLVGTHLRSASVVVRFASVHSRWLVADSAVCDTPRLYDVITSIVLSSSVSQ